MALLKNTTLIDALLKRKVERQPLWIMRQAGRYLPEYRELRSQSVDFIDFFRSPAMAAEATLQPLARFDLDAAIIFSDILVIPHAMGASLEFISGQGPVVHDPIRTAADVAGLSDIQVARDLDYVLEAIDRVVTQLEGRVPLIGFAGSPWTVAAYMIEGQGSKDFITLRRYCYHDTTVLTALLERLTEATIAYLNAQVAAGVRTLMVFDTWGGLLDTENYHQFSLHYLKKIAQGVIREVAGEKIPLIFFTKQGGRWLEAIADSGCDAMGLDWTVDIADAESRVGARVALQGNLDPAVLLSSPARVRQEAKRILDAFQGETGHVFNLGHGIHKDTPIENVSALVDAVHGVEG